MLIGQLHNFLESPLSNICSIFFAGFIVVAACVMTFEQRDNAAKVIPNRIHLNSMHGQSINRHSKPSPGSRQPFREGSGRRHIPGYLVDPLEDFSRRDLTADFIQFSRNLQQASIEKNLVRQTMGRSPSAPNLAVTPDLLSSRTTSPLHTKHSRNSLHPLIGQSFLSPHVLHRQALSVDNSDYYPHHISPPRSKKGSRQGSTSTGKGSEESLEAEFSKKSRSSQASMMLDLHMPNDCPVSVRIRDRNKRSDTARRHLLVRQAQIESEEESAERDSRCSSPQTSAKTSSKDDKYHSSSTPHSRRESLSPHMTSIDDPSYHHRYRLNEIALRGSSPSLQHKRGYYLRANTICNEVACRRSSNTSEAGYRKGSADYNYRNRRKSSNTSESGRYSSRTNVEDRLRQRSPTASLRSFQELRYSTQRLNEKEIRTDLLRQIDRKRKQSKSKTAAAKGKNARPLNQSLSPDSVSVSSSTTEGHSKSDFTSIEVESTDDDVLRKM